MLGWNTAAYAARARAFGWRAIEVDGHDLEAIDRAYAHALERDGRPVAIFARTVKAKGVAALEDRNGFHGKPIPEPDAAIAELGGHRRLIVAPQRPFVAAPPRILMSASSSLSWLISLLRSCYHAKELSLMARADQPPSLDTPQLGHG